MTGPWEFADGTATAQGRFALPSFAIACWLVSALIAASLAERIRSTSLLLLTGLASAICAPTLFAWIWTEQGWLVRLIGAHDAFGGSAIHALAGGFALGILHELGPRVAAIDKDGNVVDLPAAMPWLQSLGMLFILVGLFGLAVSTLHLILISDSDGASVLSAVGAYGTPTPLSRVTTNLLVAACAGLLVGHVLGQNRPQRTFGGAIAGVVGIAAGGDAFHPLQALLIGAAVAWFAFFIQLRLKSRFGIDDPMGIISFHGASGFAGTVICGFVLWTFPSTLAADATRINPLGNAGIAIMAFFLFGYLPGYFAAKFMNYLDALRIPLVIEIAGADLVNDMADADLSLAALELEQMLVSSGLEKPTK